MVESVMLTPEEQRWLKPLFLQYDLEDSNIAMGERVRPLLEQSGLSPHQLSQIWQIVDVENRGFLDFDGFAKVMRLVYHAQRKLPLSPRLANIPAGMPTFTPQSPVSTAQSPAPAAKPAPPKVAPRTPSFADASHLQAFGTGGSTVSANGETRIPPLRTAEKQRYGSLFDQVVSSDGFVDGKTARDVFLKARLPQPVLGQIWALIDVEGRGKLTKNEFVVAMHLIQSLIENSMPNLPSALPSAWQPWLGTRPPLSANLTSANLTSANLTASGTGSAPPKPVARHTSGSQPRVASITIDPAEREQFDRIFDSLDQNKAQILGPSEAVPVLMKSGLSEDVLARVWDLADTRSRGQLDKSDFALAMHFVKAKLNGQELPSEVPPNTAVSPTVPSQPAKPEGLTDLVSLDNAVFKPLEPVKPRRAATDIDDRRFVPTTSFGQQLLQQRTVPEAPPTHQQPANQQPANQQPANQQPTNQQPTNQHPPELPANLARQATELESQISQTQAAHAQSSGELATVLQTKTDLENRLKELKTTYDLGTKQVHDTQQQIRAAKDEIQKLEREIALRQSGLSAIQSQHSEEQQTLQTLEEKRLALVEQQSKVEAQHASLQSEIAEFATRKLNSEQELAELSTRCESLQREIAESQQLSEQHRRDHETQESKLAAAQQQERELKNAVETAKQAVIEAQKRAARAQQEAVEAENRASAHERELATAKAALSEAESAQADAINRVTAAESRAVVPVAPTPTSLETSASQAAQRAPQAAQSAAPAAQPASPAAHPAPPAPQSASEQASESLSVAQARSLSMGSAAPPLNRVPTDLASPTETYDPLYASKVDPAVFRLPMQRPHSVSSSVVNNPPQSVRGDLGSEISENPTPEVPGSPLDLDSDNSFEFVDAQNAATLDDSSDDAEEPANPIPVAYSTKSAQPKEPETTSHPPMPGSLPSDLVAEANKIVQGSSQSNSIDELYVPSQTSSVVNVDAKSVPAADLPRDPLNSPPSNYELAPPHLRGGGDSRLKLQPSFTYPLGPSEAKPATFNDDFADFDDLEEAREDEGDDTNLTPLAYPPAPTTSVNAGPDEWQQLFMKMPAPSNATAVGAGEPGAVPESFELSELVNMGFSREEASEALQKYQHNLSEATNYLLDNIR